MRTCLRTTIAAIAMTPWVACTPDAPALSDALRTDSIELARSTRGSTLPEPVQHSLEVLADGSTFVDGVACGPVGDRPFRERLDRVARSMTLELFDPSSPQFGSIPGEPLCVRIDANATFEDAAAALVNCDDTRVTLWDRWLAVVDPLSKQERYVAEPGRRDRGTACSPMASWTEEPPPGLAAVGTVLFADDTRRGSRRVSWTLVQPTPSPRFDRATRDSWAEMEPLLTERASLDQTLRLYIAIDPELPWSAVVALKDRLPPCALEGVSYAIESPELEPR